MPTLRAYRMLVLMAAISYSVWYWLVPLVELLIVDDYILETFRLRGLVSAATLSNAIGDLIYLCVLSSYFAILFPNQLSIGFFLVIRIVELVLLCFAGLQVLTSIDYVVIHVSTILDGAILGVSLYVVWFRSSGVYGMTDE